MYSIWNPSNVAQPLLATFQLGNGQTYLYPVTVPASGTAMIDVKEIAEMGTPDVNGNQLPASVTQGRVSFSAASGKPVDPMNVVISGGICNPAKAVCGYTCETCDGCTTFQLVPNPGSGTVGVLMQFYAQCPWTTGVLQDYTGTSVWATDPVIISFEGPGLGDPTDPGSTTVSAQMGTITVYKPASLSASGTPTQSGTQPCTGPCLANPNTGSCSTVTNGKQCSYTESLFTRSYNVVSQFPGVTFPSAGIPLANIAESVNLTSNNCAGSGISVNSSTTSNFTDTYGKCDSCCFSGGPGCTTTASQTITVNGITMPTEKITVTCTTASVTP